MPRRGRLIQVLPLGSRYSYQRPRPVFIGCRARLRRVVDEIIGKKLLEQAPVAFACTSSAFRRTTAIAASPTDEFLIFVFP